VNKLNISALSLGAAALLIAVSLVFIVTGNLDDGGLWV
jgi:hypothetical protein